MADNDLKVIVKAKELATHTFKLTSNCNFTVVVPEMTVTEPIQIIPCTDEAAEILSKVAVWKL